jgi:type II secretory ATPase GspE/PulE/Tfp pilus assembly ATPase PilB-like protein
MTPKESIAHEQKKLYAYLVQKGKVSSQIAENQPTSDSKDSLVPDCIRVCKDDLAVAGAVAYALDIFHLEMVEDGIDIKFSSMTDNWLVYDNKLCVPNPYDRQLLNDALDWARREGLSDLKRGVVSQTYLGQLQAVHCVSDLESDAQGVDGKLALQVVDEIIRHAAQKDASDIHFMPGRTDKVDLLYRIDGVLRNERKIDYEMHEAIVRSVMDTRSHVQLQTNKQQDGKFEFKLSQNKTINLRVSTMPVVRQSNQALKLVIRILGNNTALADLDRLGLSPVNKQLLIKFGGYPNGMIILTGPTGSGKTTTLNAQMLHMYSTNPNRNFHTIEDPVELQHEGISHTEVSVNLSFAQALRGMLRQDPDIMLVGEMRDNETAGLAYKAAMTGHLILTTLHTNNTHESIGRLLEMEIPTAIIVTNTTAFIAQRLSRALCKQCKVEYRLKDDQERYEIYGGHPLLLELGGETKLFKANPDGCAECGGKANGGEKGRRGLVEILEITPEVQVAILSGVNPAILRRDQIQRGTFKDLWDDGIRLLLEGVVGFKQLEDELKPYMQDRLKVDTRGSSAPSVGIGLSQQAITSSVEQMNNL